LIVNRADTNAWRRTGIRLAAAALVTGCVTVLPAAPALAATAAPSVPARHVTTSWGHANTPVTQSSMIYLGNGRSWALRTQ
jgi:hypothetical protein